MPDSSHSASGAPVIPTLRYQDANAAIEWLGRAFEFGSRGYSCLDPEGHLWSFGSYDPWDAS